MPASLFARAALPLTIAVLGLPLLVPVLAAGQEVPAEATVCHDGALPRQRTEIDASISVPGFDPALGTLLEVQVPSQSVHLDTDAKFENTAQSAVTFSETMTYQVTFTSPGGLGSPAPITGSLQRIPSQTLAAFDGTLDYLGASAVTQPSTSRDESAAAVSSTDPGVLAAFTGTTLPFHVATSIGEVFNGGGGNVEFQINTYGSAAVQVCYRYALPVPPGPATPPLVAGARAGVPAAPVPASARFTG